MELLQSGYQSLVCGLFNGSVSGGKIIKILIWLEGDEVLGGPRSATITDSILIEEQEKTMNNFRCCTGWDLSRTHCR
jgi:hypothetical protein